MRMKSGWLLVFAGGVLAVLSACSTANNINNPSGTGFMWVATQGDLKVTSYSIKLSNGSVSQVGSPASTGNNPVAMVLAPDGKTLFVANRDDNTVSAYAVNSDGSLGKQATTTNAGIFPVALAVDPGSKFLFAANQGTFSSNTSGTVSVFSIQGTTLTQVTGSPFPTELPSDVTGTGPSAVIASPSGNFVYVANQFTSTVSIFSYDQNGFLTQPAGPPVPTAANPSALAFSRCAGVTTATTSCPSSDGDNLFVADSGLNEISVFGACIQTTSTCAAPNGTLTAVANSPFGSGNSPSAFMIHPTLNFVYTVDSKSNQISEFKYSPATGALSALSPAAISTSSNPLAGGITSDGQWAFVPNNGGSTISAFSVGTAGKLNPASTPSITVSGQPSVVVVR